MNRQTLEYFITLTETLNFTEAAKRQFVSQTTISRAIKQLEKELGFELFTRSTTKVTLTAAGQVYQKGVKQLLMNYDLILADCQCLSQTESHCLKVGFSNDLGLDYVSRVLKRYQKKSKNIEFVFQENRPSRLLPNLKDGLLDVIAVFSAELEDEKQIESMRVCQCSVKLGVGVNHRFAGRNAIDASELFHEKIILPSRESFQKHAEYIISTCRLDGFEPDIIEVDSYEGQILLTELGKGVAFFPVKQLSNPTKHAIMFMDIRNTHHQCSIAFAWNKKNKSAVLADFLETTREVTI
ncbi:LysR family transcriptional regulator [Eubacteriaceae bacterium ES2]|nr:LysR family transcriptional regulator [Eubacteriaceae bacterium ES2]